MIVFIVILIGFILNAYVALSNYEWGARLFCGFLAVSFASSIIQFIRAKL